MPAHGPISMLAPNASPQAGLAPAFAWLMPAPPTRAEAAPQAPGVTAGAAAARTPERCAGAAGRNPAAVPRLHEAVFDQLSVAVFVVDAAAHMRYANRAARELLVEGGTLRLCQGQVRAVDQGQENLLFELVGRCRACREPRGAMLGGQGEQQAYWATVSPLYAQPEVHWTHPQALYLAQLTAPWRRLPWEFALIRQSFDLSVAEAQVVCALAEGMSVDEFAQRSGLAVEHIEQRLRMALNKTGLRAQSELVQVMGRVSPLAAITKPDVAAGAVQEAWSSSFT